LDLSQTSEVGICGEHIGNGVGLYPSTSVSPANAHSTNSLTLTTHFIIDTKQSDPGGKVNILVGHSIGILSKNKVYVYMCLIPNITKIEIFHCTVPKL
jgi:hypothetical protein